MINLCHRHLTNCTFLNFLDPYISVVLEFVYKIDKLFLRQTGACDRVPYS